MSIKINKTISILVTVIIFYCVLNVCFADVINTATSVEEVKNSIKDFITKNITVNQDETVNVKIDSSHMHSVAACSKEIEIDFPKQADKETATTIELTCQGEKGWHLYVPVTIEIMTKVVTAKHALYPKEVISEDDLTYTEYDRNHLFNGYFKNKEDIIGQVSTSVVVAGSVITKKSVHQPQIVRQNQEISLVAKINSIEITMKGIAKSDGGLNDHIKVFNPSSKKMIDAIVIGYNEAEVVAN